MVKGEGMMFSGPDEVRIAYDNEEINIHAAIKVRIDGKMVDTTVGRIILREIVPEEIPFDVINRVMNKKELANLIDYCYRYCGDKKTVVLSDRVKDLGYEYATRSGISISIFMPGNTGFCSAPRAREKPCFLKQLPGFTFRNRGGFFSRAGTLPGLRRRTGTWVLSTRIMPCFLI